MFVCGGFQLTTMSHCGMIPLLLAIQFIGLFPTIEGGIKCAEPLIYFVNNSFLGTVQNKVSIHDILEKAKVMLGNSATRGIQNTDSDTGEKLQGL